MEMHNLIKYFIIISLILFPLTSFSYHDYDLKLISFFIISLSIMNLQIFKKSSATFNENNIINKTPFCIFVLLLASTLISWYHADYPYYSTRSLVFFWTSILSFLVSISLNNTQTNHLIKTFLILISISSIYVILEYIGFISPYEVRKFPIEITGHIGHKNIFAFLAMVSIIWNFYFYITTKRKLFIIILFPTCTALLLSDSRGAILLTFFGLILLIIPNFIKLKLYKIYKFRLFCLVSTLLFILIPTFFWNNQTWLRFAQILNQTATHSHRSEIYKAQWLMFLDSPFLGSGIGSFIHNNFYYWTTWMKKAMPMNMITYNGHCEYLETLAEFGLFGFTLYFFFWFGAIYQGIKKLRVQWNFYTYTNLIILILMMLHASFSVASKRAPSSYVLWFHVGFFFKDNFKITFYTLNSKLRKYNIIVFNTISIIIFMFFMQILLGDYFYKSSRIGTKAENKSIVYLKKSLDIYPNHPYSLYQTARFSMGVQNYKYTINACNTLTSKAPNIFPISYLKGEAFLLKGDLDSALFYTEKELNMHPNYLEAIDLKCKILSKKGECGKLLKIQNHYNKLYSNVIIKPSKSFIDSVDNENLTNHIGPLRTIFFKRNFTSSWENHKNYNKLISTNNIKLINNIKAISCK